MGTTTTRVLQSVELDWNGHVFHLNRRTAIL